MNNKNTICVDDANPASSTDCRVRARRQGRNLPPIQARFTHTEINTNINSIMLLNFATNSLFSACMKIDMYNLRIMMKLENLRI